MKRILRMLLPMLCIISMIAADVQPVMAKVAEAETAAKTVRAEAEDEAAGDEDAKAAEDKTKSEDETGSDEETDAESVEKIDASEMTQIHISDYEDWCGLARKCSLDSWSRDKYVILTDNIDFSMKEFMPIPYFAGIFEGNGYTVNKAAYTDERSSIGIFSKTAESAVIRNLNVIGVVKPSGEVFNIGGIAGENAGLIANCSYDGYVEGFEYVGGIAGYNVQTGIITGCTIKGKITGLHHVGGIAGANSGLITGCSGSADINTVTKDTETGIADIKVEEMFTSLLNIGKEEGNKKSLSASDSPIDIGGIAGNNTGEISSCISDSTVGYEHVGYNVGGIAGRQSGYIHNCTNTGYVRGRKDAGGIVGQAEPYIRLDLSADIIAQISTAINNLHDSVDQTIKDTDNSSAAVSARLNVVKSFADRALSDTGYLANGTEDFVNGVVSSTNELIGRAEYIIGESSKRDGPLEDIADAGSNLRNAASDLERAAEDLDVYNYLDDGEKARYDDAKKAIEDATDEYEEYYEEFYESPEAATKREEERQKYIDEKADAGEWPSHDYDDLTDAQKKEADRAADAAVAAWAAEEAKNKYDSVHAADTPPKTYLEVMSENAAVIADIIFAHADEIVDNERRDGKAATKDLKKMAQNLKDAGRGFREIISDIAGRSPVRFPELSDEFRMHTNSLVSNIQGMSDNLGFLNSEMQGSTDKVCTDLEGVNDRFSALMLLFTDAMDGALEMDYSEVFEDESNDVCEDSVDATIADCENRGNVNADINTGGITGTMAQEYDFDLEGDLTGVKDAAKKSTYRTKCVLRDDTNRGEIKGKKSYVGGVCGLHEIGTILRCSDFAKVSSETSDYVGGIAGRSYATIKNSYEKGILAGQSYIGGIAGAGTDMIGCASMPTVTSGKDFIGAIAGSADNGGKLKDNVFVSRDLAGIDRISLAGKAEPIEYTELLAMDGSSSDFSSMNVSFIVDGKTVAKTVKHFGDAVLAEDLPSEAEIVQGGTVDGKKPADDDKVELSDDEYIEWETDGDMTVYSDSEVKGDIVRYALTLASEQVRPNKQSVFLVDGRFSKNDALIVTAVSGEGSSAVEYKLHIPDDGKISHRIRYQKAEDAGDVSVMLLTGGVYSEIECGTFGKYLTFEAEGNDISVKISEKEKKSMFPVIIGAGSAAALLVIAILLIKTAIGRKKRRRREAPAKEKAMEKEEN